MDCAPDQIFRLYFAELERSSIPYVVLHTYHDFPDVVRSDVDYAVEDENLNRAYEILREIADSADWKIIQTLQYDIAAYYSVLVDLKHPGRFLKMDRSSHYTRNGCSFVAVDTLLEARRKYNGFFIPAPSSEFIYTLTKAFAKSKDIPRFLPYLKQLWQAEPERSQQLFAAVFGPDQGRLDAWFDRPADDWQQLSKPMHARNRYGPTQQWREAKRRLRRVLHPTGLRMSVLGPDGAGKSAVIERLQLLIAPAFRYQRMIHFCPMLFRKKHGGIVTEPHAHRPRTTIVSWIKVFYHFFDHWIDYLVRQWAAKVCSTCIVFDREFNDLLVDPTRYRLRNSAFLVRLLRHLLPPTDITLILDAEPDTIHSRKPELPVEEIKRQRSALRALAASSRNWIVVSAEPAAEQVAQTAWRHVVDHLAEREAARYNRGERTRVH